MYTQLKSGLLTFITPFLVLLVTPAVVHSFEFKQVTDNVYAYIGPLENRTPENLGLNNNIGLVVTTAGAVLIDSGAGDASAEVLERAAKNITSQPIVAVINTGSQDHRWLGNHYFQAQGVEIYALQLTVKTQQKMAVEQVARLAKVSDKFLTNQPLAVAQKPFEGESAKLTIGETEFELNYYGNAHFPGDIVVWLPEQQVLFSDDLIYVDRMLGVHPFSDVLSWQAAFHQAEKLPAQYIVPGHGQLADWELARQDTGRYLDKLVTVMSEAVDEMQGVGKVVKDNADWPEFKHLEHYDSWHKRILSRTFLQFEERL